MSDPIATSTAARTASPTRLVLASASSRRQALLRDAGYVFDVESAGIDEVDYPRHLGPTEVPIHLARVKARAVAERFAHEDLVVLAADTLIVFNDRIVGKPADANHARRIITLLSGTTHIVISGLVALRPRQDLAHEQRVMSAVRMKVLTPGEVERYIASGLWQGKAGAYGIQDGSPFVERVSGCYTNIVGLPMTTTKRLLRLVGVEPAA